MQRRPFLAEAFIFGPRHVIGLTRRLAGASQIADSQTHHSQTSTTTGAKFPVALLRVEGGWWGINKTEQRVLHDRRRMAGW